MADLGYGGPWLWWTQTIPLYLLPSALRYRCEGDMFLVVSFCGCVDVCVCLSVCLFVNMTTFEPFEKL